MEREAVLSAVRAVKPDIEAGYPIRLLGLVGSMARGEADSGSDVDILVEYRPGLSLFKLEAVRARLSDAVHRDVAMVFRAGLHPAIERRLTADLIPL